MPRALSTNYREKTGSTSGEAPLILIEIAHPQLAIPIRVVNDNQDVVCNGDNFIAFSFSVTMPDDQTAQLPQAKLAIDNVGRELVQWLEASQGGKGSSVRLIQIMRNAPDVIEFDITLDLLTVSQDIMQVTATLGYEDTLNIPGLNVLYRPENTPGLF